MGLRGKMFIGFTGSHGTGKTTTAEALEKISGWSFMGSTARTAAATGLPVNKDATELSQLLVTVSRANQVLSYDVSRTIVTDRTPLDSYAYTTYQAENMWTKDDSDLSMFWYLEQSKTLVRHSMQRYEKVFYFPVLWGPEDDGLRIQDVSYQRSIDERIRLLLQDMDIEYVKMPDGTPEERAFFIKAVLERDSIMV
jgi:hypothetical protein